MHLSTYDLFCVCIVFLLYVRRRTRALPRVHVRVSCRISAAFMCENKNTDAHHSLSENIKLWISKSDNTKNNFTNLTSGFLRQQNVSANHVKEALISKF